MAMHLRWNFNLKKIKRRLGFKDRPKYCVHNIFRTSGRHQRAINASILITVVSGFFQQMVCIRKLSVGLSSSQPISPEQSDYCFPNVAVIFSVCLCFVRMMTD